MGRRWIADLTEFEAVERGDPSWAAAHLCVALGWAFLLPVGKAPEAIAYTVLACVSLARWPRTRRLYPALLRAWPFLLLLAAAGWQAIALWWSSAPDPRWSGIVPRSLFLPLMLWPLLHRWPALAAASVAGTVLHAGVAAWRVRTLGAVGMHSAAATLIGHLASVGILFASGLVSAWSLAAGARQRAVRVAATVALLLLALGSAVVSVRTALVGVAPGMLAAAVQLRRDATPDRRAGMRPWAALALCCVIGVVGLAVVTTMRGAEARRAVDTAMERRDGDSARAAGRAVTSTRTSLWLGAIAIWRKHPVFGAGTQSWGQEWPTLARSQPGRFDLPPDRVEVAATLPGVHNAYLQELCERGPVGLALLLALLGATAAALWRQEATWDVAAATGILVTWAVGSLAESYEIQSVAMLILAFVATRACAPVIPAPPAPRPAPPAPASA